jgi:hypothetical protein
MLQPIRLLLFLEATSYAVASLIHRGVFVTGYQHQQAAIAESLIAGVLLVGLGLTWVRSISPRVVALAAQAFALLGTLVGVFAIVKGFGPRSTADVVYHVAIILVLAAGLVVASRARIAQST